MSRYGCHRRMLFPHLFIGGRDGHGSDAVALHVGRDQQPTSHAGVPVLPVPQADAGETGGALVERGLPSSWLCYDVLYLCNLEAVKK